MAEGQRFRIASAYTELNDFAINPNLWYCDLFAYSSYGGHYNYNYDWLCNPPSMPFEKYVITGLEDLQAVYAKELSGGKYSIDALDMCNLLVEVKFQHFMQKAAGEMKELRFPLLATVHDSDSIAEFGPKAV